MVSRLTFTLAGRDELSRVLDNTADASDRLRLRMAGITGDADGRLRDLQGNLITTADAERRLGDHSGQLRGRMDELEKATGKLGAGLRANLISLLPAAIPATAALANSAGVLAGQFGAVAVSAAAYGLALKPQITAIGNAVDAQVKYEDAVRTSGARSEHAVKAQVAYQQQLAKLPPATREAAVAVGLLKDNYQKWSDSLAGDVMAPFNKGVAIANDLLPKTSGLVKGASTQFDRLITMLGGAIATPGFDRLTGKFTDFADQTMDHAVDELNIFLAKLDTGEIGAGFEKFLDYARANGPAVWETLKNLGDALVNVLQAGSDVGVGMLDLVNALSGIVAAVPPEAIATLLQLAIAIKAVRLAAVGADAAKAAMLAIGTQIAAMSTAAAGAPTRLAGVTAAIGSLSRGAKLAVAGTGIGLLLVALTELSSNSQKAPPDVDKLTTSLKIFAETGKVSGEAARAFGKDLSGLGDSLQKVTDPQGLDKVQQSIISFFGTDSTPVKNAKEDIDAFDKSLASLVSSGNAKMAAAALQDTITKLGAQGKDTSKLRGQLDDYNDALAGQALEQQLAAQSMGLFGEQAQKVQSKLDAQKQSADGLRQSIEALNNVNRQGLDGQIGFEAAIDAATKAAKENAGVLDMQGGKLTLNTDKQRAAAQALNDLASKTDEAAASARESGASWQDVNAIYERGREQLIKNAEQMGLNRDQAKRLADQILKTPDKTAKLKGNLEDLQAKLASAKRSLKSVPDSRKAKVRADISALESQIAEAKRQLAILNGSTVTVYINGKATGVNASQYYSQGPHAGKARGGLMRYAAGGDVQFIPFGGPVSGPGTGTSDSIPAWVSNGEYVIKASAVQKYGVATFDALNAERFADGGFTYAPTQSSVARISLSTVSSSYDQDMQRLKDAWTKLNEALREQAKKSTAATRRAVAQARQDVNAADRALGLKPGAKTPSGFSLAGYNANLKQAVKDSDAWERNLDKIGKRAGSDVEATLRDMGESGRSLVAALAKATGRQFTEIVANLRKLAPTASATLSDFTKQLNASTSSSKAFQSNLLKLAASGYGDLAMQLAGQGDETAMAVAAAAVKSGSAAKKANAAVKANGSLLTSDELTAATEMLGVLSGKKGATIADVLAAGVSWSMVKNLAPRYAKQIKQIPGSEAFVAQMRDQGVFLARGGLLTGAGTPTSDSIPLWGSTGEFMMRATAVQKYGLRFMEALNSGRLPVGRAAMPGLPATGPDRGTGGTPTARPEGGKPITVNLYGAKQSTAEQVHDVARVLAFVG